MVARKTTGSRRTTRTPAAKTSRSTRTKGALPEQNVATEAMNDDRSKSPPYRELRLPHERDEVSRPQDQSPRKAIERAARDIREGKIDTDCYGAANNAFNRRQPRRGG
jgi:hypothetical protein